MYVCIDLPIVCHLITVETKLCKFVFNSVRFLYNIINIACHITDIHTFFFLIKK